MRITTGLLMIAAIAMAVMLLGSSPSMVQAAEDQVIRTGESARSANIYPVYRYGGIGIGYGGRWGGVYFRVPLGGSYGGYYGRPYGYEEKCHNEGGNRVCRWVPKKMYWDWQNE